jgi:hypothetical protein
MSATLVQGKRTSQEETQTQVWLMDNICLNTVRRMCNADVASLVNLMLPAHLCFVYAVASRGSRAVKSSSIGTKDAETHALEFYTAQTKSLQWR